MMDLTTVFLILVAVIFLGIFIIIGLTCLRWITSRYAEQASGLGGRIANSNPLMIKAVIIGFLTLLMLIPTALVHDLMNERNNLYHSVLYETDNDWGQEQTIAAPVLVVPFVTETRITTDQGKEKIVIGHDKLIILPDQLSLSANLDHEFRERSIYRSLVYTARVEGFADFSFNPPPIPNLQQILYDQAYITIALSDNSGIAASPTVTIDNKKLDLMPGTGLRTNLLASGFSARPTPGQDLSRFSVKFDSLLRGSRNISAIPLGMNTQIKISADWPHPSFRQFLPKAHEIDNNSFKANWEISHLSRNYPQVFTDNSGINLQEVIAEARLFEPISHYGTSIRAAKYGIMFIALTYLMLLIFEFTRGVRLHLVQYTLVGVSLSVFYLLLLTLSEHLSFAFSYGLAAGTTVLSIASYVTVASHSKQNGLAVAGLLAALYGFLYSILQMEDYALTMGSGLVLLVLLLLMYLTRNLNRELREKPDTTGDIKAKENPEAQ
ncbi:cell envelope integrity protein CreD [Kiloniella laminariae]|uniref:Cell envelope integrity protein CreD n=1 Tax=Kiloniella laminariae TaxID=454162 RepID=A0ABT4LE88_9PROT|nr:cell envelope integrity protein CreD [Kiloniella laminariae]MCZ4279413.1 cell envelope integrity protein CreD [Kiloniella laminariae]